MSRVGGAARVPGGVVGSPPRARRGSRTAFGRRFGKVVGGVGQGLAVCSARRKGEEGRLARLRRSLNAGVVNWRRAWAGGGGHRSRCRRRCAPPPPPILLFPQPHMPGYLSLPKASFLGFDPAHWAFLCEAHLGPRTAAPDPAGNATAARDTADAKRHSLSVNRAGTSLAWLLCWSPRGPRAACCTRSARCRYWTSCRKCAAGGDGHRPRRRPP